MHGVEKPADVKRMRRMNDAEYAATWAAHFKVGAATLNHTVADVFVLLAISGWRSSEARCLKWSEARSGAPDCDARRH